MFVLCKLREYNMPSVITADIIASRKLVNQEKLLSPLKNLLATWGNSPKDWKLDRGDFFQVLSNFVQVVSATTQFIIVQFIYIKTGHCATDY
jgi:hypothetical protein